MPKIRNIIIFTAIAASLVLIYIFFIKKSAPEDSLISLPSNTTLPSMNTSSLINLQGGSSLVADDFLNLLLSVKNIKLDDAILSDPAFTSLHDSSITLIPDGNEGRVNPFAQFGNDPIPAIPVVMPATPTAPNLPL